MVVMTGAGLDRGWKLGASSEFPICVEGPKVLGESLAAFSGHIRELDQN